MSKYDEKIKKMTEWSHSYQDVYELEDEIAEVWNYLKGLRAKVKEAKRLSSTLAPSDFSELEEKFWSKVTIKDDDESCWKWFGAHHPEGYGQMRWTNPLTDKNEIIGAHRVSFFLANGCLPEVARHTCDNPPCVRPSHLLNGTHADNMRDRQERGRYVKPDPKKGEDNPRAVITEKDVIKARQMARDGMTHFAVADALGKPRSAIKQAIIGKSWNHLDADHPPVIRGVKGGGRITDEQKDEIRRLRSEGMRTKDLAERFGCTPSNISVICRPLKK